MNCQEGDVDSGTGKLYVCLLQVTATMSAHSASRLHSAWLTLVQKILSLTTNDSCRASIRIACESTRAITIRRICGTVVVS